MQKYIGLLLLPLVFAQGIATCQEEKTVNLYECNYLYTGDGYADTKFTGWYSSPPRLIYALKDSIKWQIADIIKEAINANFGTKFDQIALNVDKVKQLNTAFREYPKYKPKLPKKYSQNHELCFRMVDKEINIPFGMNDYAGNYVGSFAFEYKILNGADGTEVMGRTMEVTMELGFGPDGCYMLKRIPGMPENFLEGFKEAVNIFFSPTAPPSLSVTVKPACLFVDLATASHIVRTFRFEKSGTTLRVVDGPELGWSPMPMEKEKIGKTKKEGAGIGSGLFALAGVSNSKERSATTPFMTRIQMEDKTTAILYGFYLPITENTTQEVYTDRERSNGSSSIVKEVGPTNFSRSLNGTSFILRGTDTIGNFNVFTSMTALKNDKFMYMWNGTDSATITQIPEHWNTSGTHRLLNVKGEIYGKPMLFTNSKGGNQLDVWYDHQHVATFKVENSLPREGVLYDAEVPDEILKVLGMMACIPYSYYTGG